MHRCHPVRKTHCAGVNQDEIRVELEKLRSKISDDIGIDSGCPEIDYFESPDQGTDARKLFFGAWRAIVVVIW